MSLRKSTAAKSPHAPSSSAPRAELELSETALAQAQIAAGANTAEIRGVEFQAGYASQFQAGYASQAIRLERTLGWVLWICLAGVLMLISL